MASAPPLDSRLPGIEFAATRPPEEAPLRTDIALFLGSAERGPVGEAVRIEGWRAYAAIFGELQPDMQMPHAIKAYFENGGRIAHVIRLAPGAVTATRAWDLSADGGFVPPFIGHVGYTLAAASPGAWANDLEVEASYRRSDDPEGVFDFDVRLKGTTLERLHAVRSDQIEVGVAERSALIRLSPDTASAAPLSPAPVGPRLRKWGVLRPENGDDGAVPGHDQYVEALEAAMRVPEAALIAMPDLHRHCDEALASQIILAAARLADARLDRMVIADLPEGVADTIGARQWLARFANDPAIMRAAAFYHPWLRMRDPVGSLRAPMRSIAPSGHVTGLISRLDRARGAHVTPANDSLTDAVDLTRRPGDMVQGELNSLGVNALRCQSGRGLVVWGGRLPQMLPGDPAYVAHRRLIHRLVRAVRRVAEPLVFDPNDRMLQLTLSRAATTLLMEAFHAGVLKGVTPSQAFQINVGPEINDAAAHDAGRVICEIAVAPAVPMEFIKIRVGLSPDGEVEMVES